MHYSAFNNLIFIVQAREKSTPGHREVVALLEAPDEVCFIGIVVVVNF